MVDSQSIGDATSPAVRCQSALAGVSVAPLDGAGDFEPEGVLILFAVAVRHLIPLGHVWSRYGLPAFHGFLPRLFKSSECLASGIPASDTDSGNDLGHGVGHAAEPHGWHWRAYRRSVHFEPFPL